MITEATLSIALIFAAQATTPAAQTTTQAAAQEEAQSEEELDEDDKMVCRRVARIGTRFKKRVCATQQQWDDLADRSRTDTEDLQRRGFQPGSGAGG